MEGDPTKAVRLNASLEKGGAVWVLVLAMPAVVLASPELGYCSGEVAVHGHSLRAELLLSREHLVTRSRSALEQVRHGNAEQSPQNCDQS